MISQPLATFYSSLGAILILIAIGFFLGKRHILNETTTRAMTTILLSVAMPCALFRAFPTEFDPATAEVFFKAVIAGFALMITATLVSILLFGKKRLGKFFFQHQFAFIFNNASFLGYPLTLAIFGVSGLIPYSGLMLAFNIALFSYGVWLFERKLSWRNIREIIFNPNIIAVILGLVAFLNSFALPDFASKAVGYTADLTTPLSLLCIGFMLSQANWRTIWQKKQLFLTCFLQLILMPLLTFLLLWIMRMPVSIIQVFVLIEALPTATSLAIFAEKYRGNTTQASEIVLISTVMSALTLPVVMWFIFQLPAWLPGLV